MVICYSYKKIINADMIIFFVVKINIKLLRIDEIFRFY